jgi:hypothetical protein
VNLDSDKDMNLELYVSEIHIQSKAQYMMLQSKDKDVFKKKKSKQH